MKIVEDRPYQNRVVDKTVQAVKDGHKSILIESPCGSGKTVMAIRISQRLHEEFGYNTGWTAMRRHLIHQAREENKQTLNLDYIKFFSTFDKNLPQVDLLVEDEGHHSASATSTENFKIIDPKIHLLLTATPVRTDRMKLCYSKSIKDAGTRALIDQGYLSPFHQYIFHSSWTPETVALAYLSDRERWGKTVMFFLTENECDACAEILRNSSVKCEVVTGSSNQEEQIDSFNNGDTAVLLNMVVLCLDEQTEILTERGFVGIDDIKPEDKVANWDDGKITFEKPNEIVKRPRAFYEQMVSVSTHRANLRVTEGHAMLYKTTKDGDWKKTPARELVGCTLQIPVSGIAEPFQIAAPLTPQRCSSRKRLITVAASNLRRRENYSKENSFVEAVRRVDLVASRRFLAPSDLSNDQCKLIGFWIGDGSKCKLIRSGVEYKLFQGTKSIGVVEWVDSLLDKLGLSARRSIKKNHVYWSLSRGTGGGTQERKGIFEIEPYLTKGIPTFLWGLNMEQIAAFLEGYWNADGNHGTMGGILPKNRTYISSANYHRLSLLQAVISCRGYKTKLSKFTRISKKTGKLIVLWRLMFKKGNQHSFQGKLDRGLKFCDGIENERVWCVRTRTKNIITRREGFVSVMGNCEGFDSTILKTVFVRPGSKGPTMQMAGRVLRKHHDQVVKPYAQIVQNAATHWPFIKIASAERKFVSSNCVDWQNREMNERVNQASRAAIMAIAQINVELPPYLKKFRKKQYYLQPQES